jgi:hypothetical protein
MPLNRIPLTGNEIVAMANVSRQNKFTFSSAGPITQFDFAELNVVGLPSLMYWLRLDTPVAGVVFWPLFSISNLTDPATNQPVPNWLEFTNGAILVPGNTTVFTIRASVSVMGLRVSVPAGQTITLTTALTASG